MDRNNAAEQLRLIRRAQAGEEEACETLIRENSGLIWSIVRRYAGRGVDMEDLYQLGSLGFVKAVQGFDCDYGTRFSTYAVPKISGEIRRFLRDAVQSRSAAPSNRLPSASTPHANSFL